MKSYHMLSEHNGINLEINKHRRFYKAYKPMETEQHASEWMMGHGRNQKAIKKIAWKGWKWKQHQSTWSVEKALLIGMFVVTNAYIRKFEMHPVNYTEFYLKDL